MPRSAAEPLLRLSHDPEPVSQAADVPSGVAMLCWSHPRADPSQRADALVTSPSAPRLDALLPQPGSEPDSVHDADALCSPDFDDTPHAETPERATQLSRSCSPSAFSLTEPHPTN